MDRHQLILTKCMFLFCFVFQEHIIKTILTSARDEPSAPARYIHTCKDFSNASLVLAGPSKQTTDKLLCEMMCF